jgi:hypothetical protein
MSQIATAIIDLRRDHPNMFTPDRLLVNGFTNVARVVDRVVESGFTHVTFAVNAPINVDTGNIDLFDEQAHAGDRDKSLAKDLWQLTDYAKSKGLKVYINPALVDHTNDRWITKNTVFGAGFTHAQMFDSFSQYMGELAAKSQQHGVSGIYIGGLNHGLVSEEFRPQWQKVIDAVRAGFSGDLVHKYFYNSQSVLWDMVDVKSLWIHSTLSRQVLTGIDEIYREYFGVDSDTPRAIVDVIREHMLQSNKSVIIEHSPINAGDTFVGDNFQLSSFFNTGSVNTSLFEINHERQASRHAASIKLVNEEFQGQIGISVAEYSPWQMADWLVNPQHANNPWQVYANLGFNILRSPRAEKWIEVYLDGGDIMGLDVTDGVTRFKDLRRAPAIDMDDRDVLDMTVLEQDLGIDLWFSGDRAPTRNVDATGAVWERGNVIFVSTDRDTQPEWWCRVVGVRDVDGDNFWFG